MTILALISTSLFAIIRGSVKGAADIERLQRENDQINRFLELCRLTFHTMPSSAQLTLLGPSQSSSGQTELGISGAPTCFGFGVNPVSYEETTIGLQPDLVTPTTPEGQPRFTLAITRKDIIPVTEDGSTPATAVDSALAADGSGRYWMPLLPGVVLMQWKFFKDSTDEWLEEWSDSKWPDLIELQFQMEGRSLPTRVVWAPPELQLRAPSRTPTPASSSSGLANNNGGNNNNGGDGQGRGGQGQGQGQGGRGGDGAGRGGPGGGRGGPGGPGGGQGQGGPRGGPGQGGPRGGPDGGPGGGGGGPGGGGGGPGGNGGGGR